MITKSGLAIVLSRLEGFTAYKKQQPEGSSEHKTRDEYTLSLQKVRLEQYSTDSETAADWLWKAKQLGDITGRSILDQGAGTGILGVGALLLGAKEVLFLESESSEIGIAKRNVKMATNILKEDPQEGEQEGKASFYEEKVENHQLKAEIVIQNPPFGTRIKGADIVFLKKAFQSAPIIYSMHKSITREYVRKVSSSEGFRITHTWTYQMPLKNTYPHQKKKLQRIMVDVHRFEKQKYLNNQ